MKTSHPLFNFYRSGLRTTLEMMKFSLEDAKRFQTRQLKAITEALSDNEEKAKQTAAATTVEDLVGIQTELGRSLIKEAMLCWRGLGEAANWNPMEDMEQLQARISQMSDGFREMLGLSPMGMESVTSMWKSMFDAYCNACAMTSRATADATRLATDQMGLATLVVPEESTNARRSRHKAA